MDELKVMNHDPLEIAAIPPDAQTSKYLNPSSGEDASFGQTAAEEEGCVLWILSTFSATAAMLVQVHGCPAASHVLPQLGEHLRQLEGHGGQS